MDLMKPDTGLAYIGAVPVDADVVVVPGRGLSVVCTVAGNVSLVFANGSALIVPVAVGLTILPFAVKKIVSATTTATATYAILR